MIRSCSNLALNGIRMITRKPLKSSMGRGAVRKRTHSPYVRISFVNLFPALAKASPQNELRPLPTSGLSPFKSGIARSWRIDSRPEL